MQHYGVYDLALNLFKNYLEDSRQFVHFDESNSEMKFIHKGVPQGSILGPLYFWFIHDISNSSNVLNFLMYVDDTMLYICPEDIDSVNTEQILNGELQCVNSWLSANKLTLNVNKSKYMLFGKHKITHLPELKLLVNNSNIESSSEFNFLGLHRQKIKLGYTYKCSWHQNYTYNWHDQ